MELTKTELAELLMQYGIPDFKTFEMIDSSHGENDIRNNYIVDKAFVLRMNSARVMTEERIAELNTLIDRYREFGMLAPRFLPTRNGTYVVEREGWCGYLSEYLDYALADDVKETCRKELIRERLIMVANFANRYASVDLTETVSMYSIFDLSPYDQLAGIEEKQDNFNNLICDLKQAGELPLAEKLTAQYRIIRARLLPMHHQLPRCVFQGDENFSNLCVDENKHIIGLFDFNMSGTEVIANYLANIAFQGNFYYTDELMGKHSAEEVFRMMVDSYEESTVELRKHYPFTEMEYQAYRLYSMIVMISGYVNQAAFSEFMQNEEYKGKIIVLLAMISDWFEKEGIAP